MIKDKSKKIKVKKGCFPSWEGRGVGLILMLMLFTASLFPQRVDQMTTADTLSGTELFYLQQNNHDRKLTLMRLLGILASQGQADSIGVSYLIGDSLVTIRALIDAIEQNVTVLQYGDWSTPEEYGYVSGDATVYLQKSIDSAGTRKVLWQQNYAISDSLKINMNAGEVDLILAKGAKITSTIVAPTTDYYNPVGEITFYNGKRLTISGSGEISGNMSTTNAFQSVIAIRDVSEVKIEDITVRGGKYAGVRVVNSDKLVVTKTTMDSCTYANLLISGSSETTVRDNNLSYAGYNLQTGADSGYGVSFMGRYTYNSITRDNKNITIDGNTLIRNSRDGIDTHGGEDATISNNKINGFGYSGISCVNESGDTGFEKRVYNRIIAHNTITQDSLWLEEIIGDQSWYKTVQGRNPLDSSLYWQAILLGDYQESIGYPYESSGSWIVDGNILDTLNARGSRSPIFYFNASSEKTNPQTASVDIINNVIMNPNVTTDLFSGEQDGVIYFTAGIVPPKFVTIQNNKIYGTGINGIKLSFTNPGADTLDHFADTLYAHITSLNNNHIYGTFTYPYYVSSNNIRQVTRGNTYNGRLIAEMNDAYDGTWVKLLKARYVGDSTTIIDSVEVDADGDLVSHIIKITTTSDVGKEIANYEFIAIASNTSSTPSFSIVSMGSSSPNTDPATYKPTLIWRTTGNVGVLKLISANTYTKHDIKVERTSRNVPYWRTD
ncbi:MAG TPA: hypothetical protein DCX45_03560 [Acinetobacter junii]|nr:hypothetical protein [Acinetobacter junii]